MKDLSEVLKEFGVPDISAMNDVDVVLVNKFMQARDPIFIIALILRGIGRDNELKELSEAQSKNIIDLVEVNNNLIELLTKHEVAIAELEAKMSKIYSADVSGKKAH